VQPVIKASPTDHPETQQFAIVYINPQNLTNIDDLNKFQKSIQESLDGVADIRVDFSDTQRRILKKVDKEEEKKMQKMEKEENLPIAV
jgi:hypothetical protein